jgi:Protein of unknown function (DUF3618)
MNQNPDQIRDGIEQTQRDLSANVDALTTKLSPQRAMQEQVQRALTAMGSMKERVTGSAAQKASAAGGTAAQAGSTATSSVTKAAGTATAAARRGIDANPVAAGLIVLGASWLLAWLIWPSRPGSDRPGGRGR